MQRTSPATTADYAPPIIPNSLRKPTPRKLRKPALRNHLVIESIEIETRDPRAAKAGARLLGAMAARVLGAARARGVSCAIALTLLPLLTLSGCTITAMPAEATSAFKAVALNVMDQAIFDRVMANIAARVNNPGMRVSFGTEYYVETRIIGTNGELEVRADGAGNGLGASPEAREAMIRMLTREYGLTPQEAIEAIERAVAQERASKLPAPATMTPVTPPSTSPK